MIPNNFFSLDDSNIWNEIVVYALISVVILLYLTVILYDRIPFVRGLFEVIDYPFVSCVAYVFQEPKRQDVIPTTSRQRFNDDSNMSHT